MVGVAKLSRSAAVGAALLALVGSAGADADVFCPTDAQPPYSDEPNPFGWPLTPADFSHSLPDCWAEKYPKCAGMRQSPLVLEATPSCKDTAVGEAGNFAQRASYKILAGRVGVRVSKYMRSVSVTGNLGTLLLQEDDKDVEYEAVEALLSAPGLHAVGGVVPDAELLIIHKRKGEDDPYFGRVVVSVPFMSATDADLLENTDAELSENIFDQLGLVSSDQLPEADEWRAPRSLDFISATTAALQGSSFVYDGSIPAPPCTENVRWIVMSTFARVKETQLEALTAVLEKYAGGVGRRPAVSREYLNTACRRVALNDVQAPDVEAVDTSACNKWPAAIVSEETDQSEGSTSAASMILYQPTDGVKVTPSSSSLVAEGDFGGLLVNGKLYVATKISLKAVAQHTIDGVRHAAELVVEHVLFADTFASQSSGEPTAEDDNGGEKPTAEDDNGDVDVPPDRRRRLEAEELGAGAADGAETQDQEAEDDAGDVDGAERQARKAERNAGAADGAETQAQKGRVRRIMLVVPLKLGRESPLLRSLDIGMEANKETIRDGHAYEVDHPVDLKAGLASSTSEGWYWYTGSDPSGSCPGESMRWMVFEEPLEVSMKQLNSLLLKVSGFDSVAAPQTFDQALVSKGFVPHGGLEDGVCGIALYKTSCWAKEDPVCEEGLAQSPINIETDEISRDQVGNTSFLTRTSWKPLLGASVKNNGYGLGFESNQLGYSTVTGPNGFPKFYQVVEVALRMPSEHMLNGRQFPAELQVIQKNQKTVSEYDDEDATISSFFFDFGEDDEENKLLNQFLPSDVPHIGESVLIQQPVDLQWALGPALDGHFYAYDGSFTTPGCQESVRWLVFETVMGMSEAQFQAYRAVFPEGSARPVQPLNDRRLSKNHLNEPKAVDHRYFLNREMGHDKKTTPVGYIAFPIIATSMLCLVVMGATFQREDELAKSTSAGGLEAQPCGKAYDKL